MVEIVFENKTSNNKVILKLDSTNNRQKTCTISQIIGHDSDFASITPFKEGYVTTVGEIRNFAKDNDSSFSCTAFDGQNGGVSIEEYYKVEDTKESVEE